MARRSLQNQYRRVSLDKWCNKHEGGIELTAEQEQMRIDHFLKKQARDMGLQQFDPSVEEEEALQLSEEKALVQKVTDRENLDNFCGLRQDSSEKLSLIGTSIDSNFVPKTESTKKEVTFPPISLSRYRSAADLQVLGLDHLKHELQRLGLKCGGTLSDRCSRLFLTKDVVDWSKLPTSIFATTNTSKNKKRKKPETAKVTGDLSSLSSFLEASHVKRPLPETAQATHVQRDKKRESQQGPQLPGARMVEGQKRLTTLQKFRKISRAEQEGPRYKPPKQPRGDRYGPIF